MAKKEFDEQAYQEEHQNRLDNLRKNGEMTGENPNETIRRTIRGAILLHNPRINESEEHPFIVMGNDGFSGRWFPAGSFQTIEEAAEDVAKKQEEERSYSNGGTMSTTFYTFTNDGTQVRYTSEENSPANQNAVIGYSPEPTTWRFLKQDKIGTAVGGITATAGVIGFAVTHSPAFIEGLTCYGIGAKLVISGLTV